jgi:hypothetical protein
MSDLDSNEPFRGLPLTPQQDSEIRHYIHCRQRSSLPWDTPELDSMLRDMLHPPELEEEALKSINDEIVQERSIAADEMGLDGDPARD